jgi:hypothetical protein
MHTFVWSRDFFRKLEVGLGYTQNHPEVKIDKKKKEKGVMFNRKHAGHAPPVRTTSISRSLRY